MKKYIVITLVTMLVVAMLILAFFTWPVADDYGFTLRAQLRGPLGSALDYYNGWSGRFVTSLVTGTFYNILDIRHLNVVSVVLTFILVTCIYLVAGILSSILRLSKGILFVLLVPIFWFGLSFIYGQVVLWPTGGIVYLLPLLMGLFVQGKILGIVSFANKYSRLELGFIWFVGVLAGNGIEFVSVTTMVMAFLILMLFRGEISSSSKKQVLVISSGVLIGAIILMVAPGNYVRATYSSRALKFHLLPLIYNLAYLFLKYTYVCKWFFVLALVSSFVFVKNYKSSADDGRLRKYSLVFLFTAFSTLVPMVLLKDFAATRTALFYGVYGFIGISIFIFSFHKKLNVMSSKIMIDHRNLIAILAFCALVNVTFDIYLASGIKSQYLQRLELLDTQKGQVVDVDVENIVGPYPSSIYNDDIKSDPNHWINVEVAKYYNFKTIKLRNDQHKEIK